MSAKSNLKWGGGLFFAASLFLILSQAITYGAPSYHPKRPHPPQSQSQISDMTDALQDLRYEIENHEAELRVFEERMNTQENIISSLRQQIEQTSLEQQELAKGAGAQNLTSDVRNLQTHANDSSKALAQYKERIVDLEKQIHTLQSAMNTLVSAMQVDTQVSGSFGTGSGSGSGAGVGSALGSVTGLSKQYVVVSGDTLEKIARKHGKSTAQIKEWNQLKNDKIMVGQKLKIFE